MAVLLALAASIFTIVGGVGGGLYMAYFACSGIVAIALTYFFSAFFVNNDGPTHSWGFDYGDRPIVDSVCDIVQCGRVSPKAENIHDSPLTFSSLRGFLSGVLYLLSKLMSLCNFKFLYTRLLCLFVLSLTLRIEGGA